jgi:hypothetical protein
MFCRPLQQRHDAVGPPAPASPGPSRTLDALDGQDAVQVVRVGTHDAHHQVALPADPLHLPDLRDTGERRGRREADPLVRWWQESPNPLPSLTSQRPRRPARSHRGSTAAQQNRAQMTPPISVLHPEIRAIYLARESRTSSAVFFHTKGFGSSFQVLGTDRRPTSHPPQRHQQRRSEQVTPPAGPARPRSRPPSARPKPHPRQCHNDSRTTKPRSTPAT